MKTAPHDDTRICRENDFDLAECDWCGFLTVNPQSDRCECGHELYPVSKVCAPGTRIVGIHLKLGSPLSRYATAVGLLYRARADGPLSVEEEVERTIELEKLWAELSAEEQKKAEHLTEIVKTGAAA